MSTARRLGTAALFAVTTLSAALAGAAEDRSAFEQRLLAELRAISPDAAVAFQQANEARDRADLTTARDFYAEVHKMAPEFVPALRRQGNVELLLGHRTEAIALCREAVHVKETPEGLSSLAVALASPPAPDADLAEALKLAARAADLAPDEPDAQDAACGIALRQHDLELLHRCATRLVTLAPAEFTTQLYFTHLAIAEGRPADAAKALEAAHAKGLPDSIYAALLQEIHDAAPLPERLYWAAEQRARLIGIGALIAAAAFFFVRARKQERAQAAKPPSAAPPEGPAKKG